MQIKWIGQSSFLLKTKNKGQEALVWLFPLSLEQDGKKLPKNKADIILFPAEKNKKEKDIFLLEEPGEYERKNIFFYGRQSKANSLPLFLIESEGIKIAFFPTLEEPTAEQLELCQNADIVILPWANKESKEKATSLTNQLEPRVIILGADYPYQQGLAKEIGLEPLNLPSYKATKNNLPADTCSLVFLNKN